MPLHSLRAMRSRANPYPGRERLLPRRELLVVSSSASASPPNQRRNQVRKVFGRRSAAGYRFNAATTEAPAARTPALREELAVSAEPDDPRRPGVARIAARQTADPPERFHGSIVW